MSPVGSLASLAIGVDTRTQWRIAKSGEGLERFPAYAYGLGAGKLAGSLRKLQLLVYRQSVTR
jgi:hypothetical protein